MTMNLTQQWEGRQAKWERRERRKRRRMPADGASVKLVQQIIANRAGSSSDRTRAF